MFDISGNNYQIFSQIKKCQSFDLENEGHCKQNWTSAIRLQMPEFIYNGDFFLNFSYLTTYAHAKSSTHNTTQGSLSFAAPSIRDSHPNVIRHLQS